MKPVRKSYPVESSILLLSYIFFTSCFFSYQMFGVSFHDLLQWHNAYLGMVLLGGAVSLMVLIVWEEMIFPVKVHKVKGGLIFRNHQVKLKTQVLLYVAIVVILSFIYFEFEVDKLHFAVWSLICLIPPIAEKIASGVENYNDYLKLTSKIIEYKNNEKEGSYDIHDIKHITILEDESKVTKKIYLEFQNNDNVEIDLHEMELDAFYSSIDNFVSFKYKDLFRGQERIKITT